MKILCPRCDRVWEYKGEGKGELKRYACCPICRSTLSIRKNRVKGGRKK
jgi:hypothetical protein